VDVVPVAVSYVAVDDGYEAFYRAQSTRAVALARSLTGSMSAAEDIAHDVLADAHKRWDTLSSYDDPAQWMRRAVANRSMSWHRRAATRLRGLTRLGARAKGDSELDPRDSELWRVVRALPTRQAQMIALVYVEQLTLPEAAQH
jgi:DNA-directed RNA polymerase specialized sigma24 family protein